MTEKMKDFLEYASKNEELRNKINGLGEQYHDKNAVIGASIAIAKENGFTLTENDFKEESQELTDDDLDNVAGGTYIRKGNILTSDCLCPAFGGGTADIYQKTCACILGGAGELTDYGKRMAGAHKIAYEGTDGAPVAMACPMVGMGAIYE